MLTVDWDFYRKEQEDFIASLEGQLSASQASNESLETKVSIQ